MPSPGALPCRVVSGIRNCTYLHVFPTNLLIGGHSMPGEAGLSIPGMARLQVGLVELGAESDW